MKKLLMLLLFPTIAFGNEYVAIGGGYAPFHSEASLENNMLSFLNLLQSDDVKFTFFAGGNNRDICDVIETNPLTQSYDAVTLNVLGLSFSDFSTLNCKHRHNKILGLTGPASKVYITRTLKEIANRRKADGDVSPFRFYYTGHGGKGTTYSDEEVKKFDDTDRRRFNRNTMSLWDNSTINALEFTSTLDLFPAETPIQILMVQCHAGGFEQINYKGGELDLSNLSDSNRCGFYAQVPSELSAGCTPESNQNIYYSNYFFSAYSKARAGNMEADYNHDGVIGSDEAHAYAVIYSPTTDIPVTTSDMLLTDLRDLKESKNMVDPYRTTSWQKIKSMLSPAEEKIIEVMSKKLGIDFDAVELPPKVYIEDAYNKIYDARSLLTKSLDGLATEYDVLKDEVTNDLKSRYPLAYIRLEYILDDNMKKSSAENFRKAIEELNTDVRLKTLKEKIKNVRDKEAEIEHSKLKETYIDRINTIMTDKLMELAISKPQYEIYKDKYRQLKSCEALPFFTQN